MHIWHRQAEPSKCKAMTISRKRNSTNPALFIDTTQFDEMDELVILDVTINMILTWSKQKHPTNISSRPEARSLVNKGSKQTQIRRGATVYKAHNSLCWMGASTTTLQLLD